MLLQTLGATNNRVMLPMLVQSLGGDESFFGHIQAVRYISICLSLGLAPTAFELVHSGSSSSNSILPLGVLLPAIAALNVAVCVADLPLLTSLVAVIEALNCVVYIMLSSLSQTVPGDARVRFTTHLRIVQSFGSAALGPVVLFIVTYIAPAFASGAAQIVGIKEDEDGNLQSLHAAKTPLQFVAPFYFHAVATAALFVAVLVAMRCSSWGSPAASDSTGTLTTDTHNENWTPLPGAGPGSMHSKSREPVATTPKINKGFSIGSQVSHAISRIVAVTSGRDGRRLVVMMVTQTVASSLGEFIPIGITTHVQQTFADAAANVSEGGHMSSPGWLTTVCLFVSEWTGMDACFNSSSDNSFNLVVINDAVASAVALAAVYAVGFLINAVVPRHKRRALGSPNSERQLRARLHETTGFPSDTDPKTHSITDPPNAGTSIRKRIQLKAFVSRSTDRSELWPKNQRIKTATEETETGISIVAAIVEFISLVSFDWVFHLAALLNSLFVLCGARSNSFSGVCVCIRHNAGNGSEHVQSCSGGFAHAGSGSFLWHALLLRFLAHSLHRLSVV